MSYLLTLREKIRKILGENNRAKVRRFQGLKFRGIQNTFCQLLLGSNLPALAVFYGTDKWGAHRYAQYYEKHFHPLKGKKIKLLEIGIGGGDDPELGGASLRMWRTYFPRAHIFGIDILDKRLHDERRIKTFMGSQADNRFLENVLDEIGSLDIVIDDGSHVNQHVLSTFNFLFPRISAEGIYVIEDVQTSYWNKYGGTSSDLYRTDTTMGYLKQLADKLNYAEYEIENYEPDYFDKHITELHFYHNMVLIQKGLNEE